MIQQLIMQNKNQRIQYGEHIDPLGLDFTIGFLRIVWRHTQKIILCHPFYFCEYISGITKN